MLLATAICFGFVIEMCSSSVLTNSPDFFDGVFVCVEEDTKNNVTVITWTIAAHIYVSYCDLRHFKQETPSFSTVEQRLSPAGTFKLRNLKESVVYVVQVTCLHVVSSEGQTGSSESYQSSEVSFVSGSIAGKVCSDSHPSNLSHGQISVCIYRTQGQFNHVIQWWSALAYGPTSCTLRYTPVGTTETRHRTETFRDLPMNSSVFLQEGASDVQMECNDSNNDLQSSGIVKYNTDDPRQRVCSVSPDPMLPVVTRPPVTEPTHYRGLHVSSLAQGLVLAFSIVLVSSLMSMLAYKRYRSYMRRRSQRLLRVETEEEANEEAAMQEFQRMV
ncbi:uncharacterized protein LOC110978485 [Acanthaster planci]|uniref:Uncharacterized protein LOC110978485 n=1 Tax=Acanthaster planci TaxID=133434 RepID=A0A8B7YBZ7_ACAPL|nr:uncharacterized protein LOC110978485 [Acanthaster planci]